MSKGTKYGLMVLPTHSLADRDEQRRQLPAGLTTWIGSLADLIAADEVKHWQEWLGSITWDAYTDKSRIVFTSMPSERPEVVDRENDELRSRVALAWHAMLLTGPVRPFHGEARCVTGEAMSVDPVQLRSVRDEGPIKGEATRGLYNTRPGFLHVMPWRDPDPWMDRWAEWIEILDKGFAQGLPTTLDVALYAFRMALSRDRLEFSIPEYVRTAECILAVPAGKGRKVFAERAMQLAPGLANHWYVGGADLEERLIKLYERRIECVHGKIPFEDLAGTGDAGKDEAAKQEYLAEALAREALRLAFRSPQHAPLFKSRALLEQAWASRQFP